MPKTVVVALGGNAIVQRGQKGTAAEQRDNIQTTARQIATLVKDGYRVIVSHGNGPQVGNILVQQEEASEKVPAMPLDVCGAKSQGYLGYMLQQALANELTALGLKVPVATIVTQVEVDPEDKAFRDPTKPVGLLYSKEQAHQLAGARGWSVKEDDKGLGWRRVVPSPDPKHIVEAEVIRAVADTGAVVIACGGGGIPVRESEAGLSGLEAVIDKDLASERLAKEVGADILLILTDVEQAAINYRQPGETWLGTISVAEARGYQAEGHFKAGSMGPKVEAAVRFAANGGEFALITSLDKATAALAGRTGTRIVP